MAGITKCDKSLLQSVAGVASDTGYITKCDKRLLQSVAGVTKCDNYYKDRRNRLLLKELRIYYRKLIFVPTGNAEDNITNILSCYFLK